jgi:hypothetical protein
MLYPPERGLTYIASADVDVRYLSERYNYIFQSFYDISEPPYNIPNDKESRDMTWIT